MKPLNSWLFAWSLIVFGFAATTVAAQNPVKYVNPRWGAGMNRFSHGNTYPEIAVPWPMTIWSPQTHTGAWFYENHEKTFQGFRATHEANTWTSDYGQFTIMPEVGPVRLNPVTRAVSFSHKTEFAHPYSYRVYLPGIHTWAQLAPTRRCAILKFTFPRTPVARIVISASDATMTMRHDGHELEIVGHVMRNVGGVPTNFACRFVARFDASPSASKLLGAKGHYVGVALTFNARQSRVVRMRVGTSFISINQARINLKREIPGWSLRAVAGQARSVWNRLLGKIDLGGATAAQKTIFYTCLYRTLLFPQSFYEVSARGQRIHYSPVTGKIYPGRLYTDTGFWDTFRSAFPLLSLVYRRQDGQIIRGFLNFYKEGGWLPTWPNPGYFNCMVGADADAVVASAYLQGIGGFNPQVAYAAIRKDGSVQPRSLGHGIPNLKYYLRLGYLPANVMEQATSTTLEEAYDDYCIAEMAKALGKTADYKRFRKLAFNYRNVFNPTTKFPWGRESNGSWQPRFDPLWWGSPLTEGDAWTYQWAVMQDPYGLIDLLGGRDAALKKLNSYFTMTSNFNIGAYGQPIHEELEAKFLGMGQYAPNNEPSSHDAFFYDFVRQPWQAQYWVRKTMDRVYNTTGMIGDEDEGQMGAWYVFNTAGIYPFSPIKPFYVLGSPSVGRVVVHLNQGRTFTIRSIGNGPKDYYIQSATLNGKPFNQLWINQRAILHGGTLVFYMGPTPNKKWASDRAAMPPVGDMTQP